MKKEFKPFNFNPTINQRNTLGKKGLKKKAPLGETLPKKHLYYFTLKMQVKTKLTKSES